MSNSARPNVVLRPLGFGHEPISAAAQTLSLAFASDPLIRWAARDKAGPGWESLQQRLQQWQEARVREYIMRGLSVEVTTEERQPKSLGVCFLFPPRSPHHWFNPFNWFAYFRILWDRHWIRPQEPFSDGKRVAIMTTAYERAKKEISSSFPPNTLYCLEIAAVRPQSQGMGAGGRVMDWVIRSIGDSPCFLECTDKKNIGFYEKYGFKLVHEIEMRDEDEPEQATYFYGMVRAS